MRLLCVRAINQLGHVEFMGHASPASASQSQLAAIYISKVLSTQGANI